MSMFAKFKFYLPSELSKKQQSINITVNFAVDVYLYGATPNLNLFCTLNPFMQQ